MAVVMPGKFDPKTGIILNMLSVPSAPFDPTFDSYLLLKNGCENHTLTLALKVFLNPVTGVIPGLPVFPVADYDKKVFLAKPWQAGEFRRFQQQFKQQALKWNDNFWLIPPAGFLQLDVKVGGRNMRPNVYCHLYVDLVATKGEAHLAIDVVNLHPKFAGAFQGTPTAQMDSGDFRSDTGTYDSLDVKPRREQSTDDKGVIHRRVNYLTVIHEIGHALGLDHIGVPHNDPMCRLAIMLEDSIPQALQSTLIPALLANGSNSRPCYGDFAPAVRGANVMGSGRLFDETNASPWQGRLALHTHTKAEDWKVHIGKIPPKSA